MSIEFILCIGGIVLALVTLAAFWFKSDAAFWEKAYRDVNKSCNEVHKMNKELIETCERDIAFAKEVNEDNKKLLDLMADMRVELEELKKTEEEES